jgi:hypothetical protein
MIDRFQVPTSSGRGASELATALETCYATPINLSLTKLRQVLERLALVAGHSQDSPPSAAAVAQVVQDLRIGDLPLDKINALVEAVTPLAGKDVLAAFTLKQLEELLSRISQ